MTVPASPPRLSPRQAQLVAVIERLVESQGYPPSYAEVAAVMRVHRTRVAQLAASAAQKGAIIRDRGRSRSWRIVKKSASVPCS